MHVTNFHRKMDETGIKSALQVPTIKVACSWFAGAARGRREHKVGAP
jgi:hypothetical protein